MRVPWWSAQGSNRQAIPRHVSANIHWDYHVDTFCRFFKIHWADSRKLDIQLADRCHPYRYRVFAVLWQHPIFAHVRHLSPFLSWSVCCHFTWYSHHWFRTVLYTGSRHRHHLFSCLLYSKKKQPGRPGNTKTSINWILIRSLIQGMESVVFLGGCWLDCLWAKNRQHFFTSSSCTSVFAISTTARNRGNFSHGRAAPSFYRSQYMFFFCAAPLF